jgi:hypothetical protein
MRSHMIRTGLPAVALAGLLAGCGSAPQMLAIDQACATDKDGSAVAIEGIVNADTAINCSNYGGDYRCNVDLVGQTGKKAGLDVLVGSDNDAMDEPPSNYSTADLRIRAHDGSAVHVGDRVRATGKISTGPDVCFVTVDQLDHA